MEWLCISRKHDVKCLTNDSIRPLWDVGIFGSNSMTLEVQKPETKAVESLRTFHDAIGCTSRMGHLLNTMNILISWCKDFEGNVKQTVERQKHFTDVAVIIHDRLVCLRDSLEACERTMTEAVSYIQVYRQWVSAPYRDHPVDVAE